ncbi:trichothecene 3-o-acetyltransferase [Phlyctema vagabunda]|uniref:Trichothecene 3-o-acetyltransferase n=1 Tax=Phlyctema vagabunda TaxID=108571 RepID=A0ABR4PEF9_9HELO
MDPPTIVSLSELDQLMPRLYIRWLLCIPLFPDSPATTQIVEVLTRGISKLLETHPILRGTLVAQSTDPSRLEVHLPSDNQGFQLQTRYYDSEDNETFPLYTSLLKRRFPASELPDNLLNPVDDPTKVFGCVANFIRGGVLLCLRIHHAVVDGGGMKLIVNKLAQACANPNSVLAAGEDLLTDRTLLPTGTATFQGKGLGFEATSVIKVIKDQKVDHAAMICHTFKFSATALDNLKHLCFTGSTTITTHDALTAILYGTVTYARSLRLSQSITENASLKSTIGIAVDGRSRLPTPLPAYTGNVTLYATFTTTIHLPSSYIPLATYRSMELLSQALKLPSFAALVHSSIAAVDAEFIQSTIGLASSHSDISRLKPSFSDFNQGLDFFITSGANNDVFETEWWPGGKVDALRIPYKGPWDGTCAVQARRDKVEGLEVLLGLREDDMKVVKEILESFGIMVM